MTESLTIHNLRRCAGPECGRLFAVCRSCGWTRRYCSSSCRDETRRTRVREAGHKYQQSIGGRQAHAARQARYRERQRVQSRVLPSTLLPDAASVCDEGGRRPGECGLGERDPEAACVPGLLEERLPGERDVVCVPLVTHHPSGRAPRGDGLEKPSGRPMVRSRAMPAAFERNVPPLPRCAFCGSGHHRTFLIVHDGPLPHPARLGRRFRWQGATQPAGPESRVLW